MGIGTGSGWEGGGGSGGGGKQQPGGLPPGMLSPGCSDHTPGDKANSRHAAAKQARPARNMGRGGRKAAPGLCKQRCNSVKLNKQTGGLLRAGLRPTLRRPLSGALPHCSPAQVSTAASQPEHVSIPLCYTKTT